MKWSITRNGTTYHVDIVPESGNRTPTWQQSPRRTVTSRAGGSSATYHLVGFEPYTLDMTIYTKSETTYTGIGGFRGYEVELSDGTSTWTTTLDVFEMQRITDGCEGYEGRLSFVGRT